jgi:hypothetical protein
MLLEVQSHNFCKLIESIILVMLIWHILMMPARLGSFFKTGIIYQRPYIITFEHEIVQKIKDNYKLKNIEKNILLGYYYCN